MYQTLILVVGFAVGVFVANQIPQLLPINNTALPEEELTTGKTAGVFDHKTPETLVGKIDEINYVEDFLILKVFDTLSSEKFSLFKIFFDKDALFTDGYCYKEGSIGTSAEERQEKISDKIMSKGNIVLLGVVLNKNFELTALSITRINSC